jgi:hypothetical protein
MAQKQAIPNRVGEEEDWILQSRSKPFVTYLLGIEWRRN